MKVQIFQFEIKEADFENNKNNCKEILDQVKVKFKLKLK